MIDDPTDIHTHFSLSYANYLVLHRTLLQSMPLAWQHRFVAMLEELDAAFPDVEKPAGYRVETGDWHYPDDVAAERLKRLGWTTRGRWEQRVFIDPDGNEHSGFQAVVFVPAPDPVPHYDRGRTRIEPTLPPALALDEHARALQEEFDLPARPHLRSVEHAVLLERELRHQVVS